MLRMSSQRQIARKRNARKAHTPGAAAWLGVRSAVGLGLGTGEGLAVVPSSGSSVEVMWCEPSVRRGRE
jgi:hypothetical protein